MIHSSSHNLRPSFFVDAQQQEDQRQQQKQEEPHQKQYTALLFGSTGAVGTQVFNTILKQQQQQQEKDKSSTSLPFWKKIILVGRRFPSYDDDTDNNNGNNTPQIIQIQSSNITNDEQTHTLRNEIQNHLEDDETIDVCIHTIGVNTPYLGDLKYWNSIEVEMTSSIVRLCNEIHSSSSSSLPSSAAVGTDTNENGGGVVGGGGVQYIGILSAVTVEEDPLPFSTEELNTLVKGNNDDGKATASSILGWSGMLRHYERIMGLKEKAAVDEWMKKNSNSNSNAAKKRYLSLFRPSSIVTQESRHGWVDKAIFKFHRLFDPIMPKDYHSVDVELLGRVIVGDAVRSILSNERESSREKNEEEGTGVEKMVTKLKYKDFLEILEEEEGGFKKYKELSSIDDGMKNNEL